MANVGSMQLGVHYANFTHPDWEHRLVDRLTETARVADEGGIAQLTVMDHWFQMEQLGGPDQPMLEGYTTLGYLAAVTSRLRLSLLVTGVTYRHPGLLAKTVTTLDVLSGGRAMLGIGAAWYDREHRGLGVPFPALKERYERLEETLQIARQLFDGDRTPYAGDALRARGAGQRPAAGPAQGADHDRRQRREEDAAPRRPVRRRLQRLRRPARRGAATSSTCCAATATTSAPTTTPSRRR